MAVESLNARRLGIRRPSEVRTLRSTGLRHGRCLGCGEEIRREELFVRMGTDVVHAACGLYRSASVRAA